MPMATTGAAPSGSPGSDADGQAFEAHPGLGRQAGEQIAVAAAFHAVTIIKDTRDGVWVVGLPYKISVITVGQEYVQPGQVVDAKTDDTPIGAGADGSNATASSEQPS